MKRPGAGALAAALAVALAVRLLALQAVDAAGIGDPNYYEDVGQALARGEGLTSRCVWSLLRLPPEVPGPGCGYWGPGVPAISGAAHALAGPSVRAPQVAILLVSLALVALAVLLASQYLEARAGPLCVGLLIAAHFELAFFSVTVDTPVPFAVAANLCLLPLALAHRGWTPGWFLALPGALAAQLTRADGLLLPALVFLFAGVAVLRRRLAVRLLVLLLVVYAVGWGAWLARQARAFGTPFPSSMAEGVLLADYSDLFRIHTRPSLERLLAQGTEQLLRDRRKGIAEGVRTLLSGENLVLVPCALLALPALVRHPLSAPFLVYAGVLFVAMTVFFTHQSRHGSLEHSLPTLFPFLMTAALFWIERARAHVAAWRPGRPRWLARTLLELAPALLVMFALLQLLVIFTAADGMQRPFRDLATARESLAQWWATPGVGGPDVRLMSNDSLDLLGLLPAPIVQEPRDPGLAPVFELARKYRLRYLVLLRVPRYRIRDWDGASYTDPAGELTRVAELPVRSRALNLDGITIYEFHFKP